ncbi:MAG: glutamate--tRNA ligase [Anaerolineales bacterium]|nr:glutamate--tRNA ligase [Anaerolineales bacterium]MCW5854867.1 glutamate--tRNA ligase [Anaerolineales bacterium]
MTKTDPSQPARVRFAPSPTGLTHLGSARTALYNFLIAQQTGGSFILRIEDTDQKRYDPNAEADLTNSLKWLGLDWDEGPGVDGPHAPYHQSQRMGIYRQHAEDLVSAGKAFYCFCTPQQLEQDRKEQQERKEQPHYAGRCRELPLEEARARVAAGETHVVRFKAPKEGSITVVDRLRGEITVENRNIDDRVLLKSDGHALYHLAAMVDDHLMGITHVFRGEEWLPSLPLHAHIYEAFGWPQPEWVHLSVFLKPSGKGKMSKRDTEQMRLSGQSIFVKDLAAMGYLPEGVLNWIALMGWSYDDKTEFFTLADMVEKFDIDKLNPSPSAIDFKKLDHFNGLHIRALSVEDLATRLLPYFAAAGYPVSVEQLLPIVPLIQTRMTTLDEAPELAGFFFKEEVSAPADTLLGQGLDAAPSAAAVRKAIEIIEGLPDFTAASLEEPLRAAAEVLGLKAGQFFGMLRNAVTAQQISPPLFESMEIVGRGKVLARLRAAVEKLETLH